MLKRPVGRKQPLYRAAKEEAAKMSYYYPEGALWEMPENRASFATLAAMEQAKAAGKILESRALI